MSICAHPWVWRPDGTHNTHHCILPENHDDEHQCFCDEREVW